ncbi:flavodoxin [Megasphaera elsdenii]|uniref:flavodoxin n=1 Tax=Megasphaera elsdenii TaxID=907 RepID=UPI00265E6CA5|nr:flavodoxin [Megasphaera elsdenii]
MKLVKIMQVVFLGAAMFLLTACGETGTSVQSTSENTASAPASGVYVPNQTGKPMSEDIKDELESKHKQEAAAIKTIQEEPKGSHKGQRILIAYFTWGGRSGEVAHMIQDKIGGDLYEIKRDPDYSRDYSTVLKESAQEVDDNVHPKLAGTQPDLSQYDVIVLGYPCWWFTAPMTIPSFLEGKDLAGKLIVPYMCSYSSPFEVTLPALAAAAPSARLFTGLTLDKDTDYSVIDPWLDKAGLL